MKSKGSGLNGTVFSKHCRRLKGRINAGQNPFAERNTINHLTTQEHRHER